MAQGWQASSAEDSEALCKLAGVRWRWGLRCVQAAARLEWDLFCERYLWNEPEAEGKSRFV